MESNFIKERVVIREKIIKKNLEGDKRIRKNENKPSTSSPVSIPETPSDRVIVFEEVVNEKLKQDLVDISKQVDTICETIAEYLKIKSALKIFRSNSKDIRVQTNLGCNFYAQCHIEDASKIHLNIGKDYYLEMDIDEAIKMCDFKEKQWMKQLDILQERAAKVKAFIKIALEAMGRLYDADKEKLANI